MVFLSATLGDYVLSNEEVQEFIKGKSYSKDQREYKIMPTDLSEYETLNFETLEEKIEQNKENTMSFDKRPNLFRFAKSELSQDAFFAWFFSWADVKYKEMDPSLYDCAQDFLKFIANEENLKINNIEVKMQKERKDITVLLTDICEKKYGILIEDKTISNESDDQLERYKTEFDKMCKKQGLYPKYIFIKTRDSETLNLHRESIESKGYKIIDRQSVLNILKKCLTKNNIFIDFRERLQEIDNEEANKLNSKFLNKLGGGKLLETDESSRTIFKLNSGDIVLRTQATLETSKTRLYNYYGGISIEKTKKYGISHWCLFDSDNDRIFKIPIIIIVEYLEEVSNHSDFYIREENTDWHLLYPCKNPKIKIPITNYLIK